MTNGLRVTRVGEYRKGIPHDRHVFYEMIKHSLIQRIVTSSD